MLGPGSGFNPPKATRAEFGFKFDSPKLRGQINLNEFERSELDGGRSLILNLTCAILRVRGAKG